jgi:hypothetical protein
MIMPTPGEEPISQLAPFAPPPPAAGYASPALIAAALTRALTRHGLTRIYTASGRRHAVISVSAGVTAWTDGVLLWCTCNGQRHTWPAADTDGAAARLAALAAPPGTAGPH